MIPYEEKKLGGITINGSQYQATIFLQPAQSGSYFDDKQGWSQLAPEKQQSGFPIAPGITPGFINVREMGESLTITLVLERGHVSRIFQGSCTAVQYSGAGGRDPRFFSQSVLYSLTSFDFAGAIADIVNEPAMETVRAATAQEQGTAKTYGLGQLFLQVAAFASGLTLPQYIARYVLAQAACPKTLQDHAQSILTRIASPEILVDLPLFIQTGDNRTSMVEELLGNLNRFSIVAYPHGLFNSIEKLKTLPTFLQLWTIYETNICGGIYPHTFLHCDTYGQISELMQGGRVTHYEQDLIEKVGDWILDASTHTDKTIRIEAPIEIKPDVTISDYDARKRKMTEQQSQANAQLLAYLYQKGFRGQVVSDENINSIDDMRSFVEEIKRVCAEKNLNLAEVLKLYMIQIKTPTLGDFTRVIDAVLYCAAEGVSVYVGGSCNETTISARLVYTASSVLKPLITQVLLRPGLDVRMGLLLYVDWQNSFIQEHRLNLQPDCRQRYEGTSVRRDADT